MDAHYLARLQFGLTIAFHYIFPPLSIGLGLILILLESAWLRTGKELYRDATKFWVKVFALIFSIGVASGIVMEFQFGTNWSTYSRFVGDVFGSALAAEGIFAFFLESGFLALLIFGWDRVGKKMHFLATLLVSLGSTFSAIWIIAANSWMQTPKGHKIVMGPDGSMRAEVVNFWEVVFNHSTVVRLWHTIMGAWQAAAWLVISVAAFYLLKKRHTEFAKASLRVAISVAVVSSILQLVSGHPSAMIVAEHQPAKMAAVEGHWKTGPAGMYLFGWYTPPEKGVPGAEGKVSGVEIPGMLSFLIHGSTTQPVAGLDQFADIPPVNAVFQSYHGMIAIGMTLILLSTLAAYFWWRKTLWTKTWFLKICVISVILPQVANQLGWFTAEVGRQPWIVYGILRTEAAISPKVKSSEIIASLVMFGLMYALLFVLFIYLLNKKIQHGPEGTAADHPVDPSHPHPRGDRADPH